MSQNIRSTIERIQVLRNSTVIALYLNDQASLMDDVLRPLFGVLRTLGHRTAIDLWLRNRGGSPPTTLRLVDLIRRHSDRFSVLLPAEAFSASTEIALGADEIVMGPFGVLSPIDIQERSPLLPRDESGQVMPFSVADLRALLGFVKTGSEELALSPESAGTMLSALLGNIEPMGIATLERSYTFTKLMTRRMLARHMSEEADQDRIAEIADALCDMYGSHSYPISSTEARKLGLKVVEADESLAEAMWLLFEEYENECALGRNRAPGTNVDRIGCLTTVDEEFEYLTSGDNETPFWLRKSVSSDGE